MEGRLYLRLLLRHLVLVVVVVLGALAAGSGLYAAAEPRYRGTLTFVVQSDARSGSPSETYQAELLSQARAQTYARLASSTEVVARLRPALPKDVSDRRIARDLSASASVGSVLVRVVVTDRDKAVVRLLMSGLVDQLPAYVADLQRHEQVPVTALALASSPGLVERVAPTKTRYGGLALLGGLMAAFLLAALRESGNRRVRDAQDARSVVASGLAVIDLPLRNHGGKRTEEAPVLLSKALAVAGARRQPLVVVSVNSGKRPAAQVYELGRRLGSQEHRVALVDFELEARQLSAIAESANPQLVVHELSDLGGAAARAKAPPLRVVPADLVARQLGRQGADGSAGPASGDSRRSAVAKLNEQLRPAADTVLVFLGGVLRRARPALRADDRVDAIVLAERGRTSKEALSTTVDVLGLLGAHVVAVVLADSSRRRLG